MLGRIWTPLLLYVFLLAIPGSSGLAVAEIQQLPAGGNAALDGLIVLRNGSVLRGAVHRAANYYHVKMDKGSLRFSADQVEMFCRTLGEAYSRRREQRTAGSADAHLELMRWCLRHRLLEQAARELLDARTIDPGHPSLSMLERQLQQLLQTSTPPKQQVSDHSTVLHVQATDDLALPPTSAALRAEFVRKIQPILVHSCATAGCHAAETASAETSREFQLSRHALGGVGHPEVTKRNLASTLAQCRGNGQDEFALLTKARKSHVGSQPLGARQIELLTAWLGLVDGEGDVKADTKVEQAAHIGSDVPVHPTEQAGGWPWTGSSASSRPPRPNAVRLFGTSSKVRHGVKLRPVEPRDPFDAEVFNRHYEPAAD